MKSASERIRYIESCESTNDLAHELSEGGTITTIVANQQLKGRGRLGREWISEANQGLYLSWRCQPNVPPSLAGALPLLAAIATHDVCSNMGVRTTLKWPNDLLCHDLKIAGILCEGRIAGTSWYGIVGIGLNLLPPKKGWPNTLKATSIQEQTRAIVSKESVAEALVHTLEEMLVSFEELGLNWVVEQWVKRGPVKGTKFVYQGRVGTYEGLSAHGALKLRLDDECLEITVGDIELVN